MLARHKYDGEKTLFAEWSDIESFGVGGIAQLGERDVRNVEASGSIPLTSTNLVFKHSSKVTPPWVYRKTTACCIG